MNNFRLKPRALSAVFWNGSGIENIYDKDQPLPQWAIDMNKKKTLYDEETFITFEYNDRCLPVKKGEPVVLLFCEDGWIRKFGKDDFFNSFEKCNEDGLIPVEVPQKTADELKEDILKVLEKKKDRIKDDFMSEFLFSQERIEKGRIERSKGRFEMLNEIIDLIKNS